MKLLRTLVCSILFLPFVAGCPSMGVPAPETTGQSLAYVYTAITSVRDTAATLTNTKVINKKEAEAVLRMTDAARSGADVTADYLKAGQESKAQAALSLAKSALREAKKYLNLPADPRLAP